MDYIEIENKNKELIDLAKKYMISNSDKEHNEKHMNDVVKYTKELLDMLENTNIKANVETCIISAYWHDVGRIKKDEGHEKESAEMLKKAMQDLKYDNELIHNCYCAIENHKWDMIPKTIEGHIVKDADKIGWIGTGRWESCINNNQELDNIVKLIPGLRNEHLYFEQSKIIYDKEIVKLLQMLYNKIYSKK